VQDLEMSYKPVELRSLLEKVQAERRPTTLREVEWNNSGGERMFLDVQVHPLLDGASGTSGATVTFTDVSRHRRLQEELQKSHQELEAAYEELQSTSEELETTNEELQSTVEELETTNEELQSSNEELETMNEELQSTNEELHTINDELRQRSDELNQANAFMNSILTSLRTGVIVVDRDLRVQAWNKLAEDTWGLREDEVRGKTFLSLDIGLPVDRLAQPLRECLNGEERNLVLDATNRRGKAIRSKISCSPLRGVSDENRGVILLLEDGATE
jgi:two-component system CheB/CheR fusion protein